MKQSNKSQAQAHVLDRMMYLLEENSVHQVAADDKNFAEFVSRIYKSIETRATNLRSDQS